MQIVKCYNREAEEWLKSQIKLIPQPIRDLLKRVKIFCFRTDASADGTVRIDRKTADGRPSRHTSHFSEELDAIIIFAKDICIKEGSFNMFLHEVGHALDWHLGNRESHISSKLDCGEPLDTHAALNPREQFAQAFEAWFRIHRSATSSEFEHTREEVKKKAPKLHKLFQQLAGEPSDIPKHWTHQPKVNLKS
jgi:hypothetical protein